MAKLVWGSDLFKGATLKSTQLNLSDVIPYQQLEQKEKTPEWLHAVADYYEATGWKNVDRRSRAIQGNYWLRSGKWNPSDYSLNPEENMYHEVARMANSHESPLQQFYPIIPPIVDVLRGEFIKRNTSFQVKQIDSGATAEYLQNKEQQFTEIVAQLFEVQKQYELSKLGLLPDQNNEEMYQQYMQEMDKAKKQFAAVEQKVKGFRTTGAQWAEKVVKIQEEKYNLKELEVEGFESGLISDREFYHLDMLDDTFRLDLLNPKWCDYHKGPNKKYVSDGDYFLWFDWMSVGDLINTLGTKINEKDFDKLKALYSKMIGGSMVVPDYMKSHQGGYYDTSKPYSQATDLNPALNDALLGKELAYSFSQGRNFQHNQDVDMFSTTSNNTLNSEPQMFRVMRLYFRSLKKIGWLTKIGRDGIIEYMDWVTEDFKVTVEPKYDNSIRKDKTKENVIYGEHIDWTWVNDWRQLIKISANHTHNFWNVNNEFEAIYIDGSSCPFQFKGKNNPFESKPPIEGCEFSYINTTSHSLVDRLKSFQILHNIYMNKVPENALNDYGNKLLVDTRAINTFSASLDADVDPIDAYADRLRNSDILPHGVTREMMEGQGQAALPQVVNFSTADYAMKNMQIAAYLKDQAGEIVGINRNRQGQSKASETATGVTSNISYSETQTEKYFEQHFQLMERVRQRMLDAAQYYSTFKDVSRELYLNEKEENVMLEMIGMENLFPHYNIVLKSTANMRAVMQQLTQFLTQENTLPFKASAKIEALASESVNLMLNATKKAEADQENNETLKHQREMELQQQQQDGAKQQQEAMRQQMMEEKTFDRDTQVQVATIRALGGVQTDSNANSGIDAKDNLDAYFKQQQLQSDTQTNRDNLSFQKQMHNDNLLSKRETNQTKLASDKIKADAALKIAKENKNKFDKK